MSTPSRRPLYLRVGVDQSDEAAPVGARRLPVEAAVVDVGLVVDLTVDQADVEPPRRRPLWPLP
ncbi:hypothetical protein ACIOJE_35245 [Kitasatospora sp. NPDC087861]|uniref:hypothetical protein n=1 Tax=Kitasatospora sp. NPDC087861 TaxID=3364070 RepID=UPI0038252FB9